jgi:hypothetical protein
MSDGAVYERTVADDGRIEVPSNHAALKACVITDSGVVLGYPQVSNEGEIYVDEEWAGTEVEVVLPSDEDFERHA